MCGYELLKSSIIEYYKNNKNYYQEIIYFSIAGDISIKDSSGNYILDPTLINKIKIIKAPEEVETKEVNQAIKCSSSF